ncbi:MAG: glycosyltransferase family 2 protein [Rhodobacteraceae bacterium]|nr:glycosyltransferase family 2 protein [Paracoccaceae bacterium]
MADGNDTHTGTPPHGGTETTTAAGAPHPPTDPYAIRPRPHNTPRPRRLVIATMKDEGPYILEWVAHHLNLGFDGFVIFSNDCTDGTNLILNQLHKMRIIQHFDNSAGLYRGSPECNRQTRAYRRARRLDVVRQADWVLVIDADEFLNIHAGDGSLDALLEAVPAHTDAISVNWRHFGSAGQRNFYPAPVTRRFTRAQDVVTSTEVKRALKHKTLFRPRSFPYGFNAHRPDHKKIDLADITWINCNWQHPERLLEWPGKRSIPGFYMYGLAQVNHYAVKSRKEYLLQQVRDDARFGERDLTYWKRLDMNACEDCTIRSGDLEGRIAALLQDADLCALHNASLYQTVRRMNHLARAPSKQGFVEGRVLTKAEAAAFTPYYTKERRKEILNNKEKRARMKKQAAQLQQKKINNG